MTAPDITRVVTWSALIVATVILVAGDWFESRGLGVATNVVLAAAISIIIWSLIKDFQDLRS